MADDSENKVKIIIPKELYNKIHEKIQGTSFTSVEEYINSKLENEFPSEPHYTREEIDLINARMRALGYPVRKKDDVKT